MISFLTETNSDKSSSLLELNANNTELKKNTIELSDGFQHDKVVVESGDRVGNPETEPFVVDNHGKVFVESGDRVEELDAEPFMVENHGKATIGDDSSKLLADNQEGNEVHICSLAF